MGKVNVIIVDATGNKEQKVGLPDDVKIGIITVPVDSAQQVCDMLVESGILAIWNFAPTHIKAPEEILVQNENMASSLALLSNHLREKMANE